VSPKLRPPRGYTLIELMLALAFASVVLFGLFNMFTAMIHAEDTSIRKASVDTWSIVGLNTMTKEIEDSSILYFPNSIAGQTTLTASGAAPALAMGCTNWSTMANGPAAGGAVNTLATAQVTWFLYCYDANQSVKYLRRVAATQTVGAGGEPCPAAGAAPGGYVTCNSGAVTTMLPGAGGTLTNDVIASYVNAPTFSYNPNVPGTGVDVAMILGNESATVTTQAAGNGLTGAPSKAIMQTGSTTSGTMLNATVNVKTTIFLNRPYTNPND
jgi:Tfp pilus assembly protein PilW